MAVVFELFVDFRDDAAAARAFSVSLERQPGHVTVSSRMIDLHKPLVERTKQWGIDNFNVTVIPARVGYGVALDQGRPRISLTEVELCELTLAIYDIVRGKPGYQLAMVGWDVGNWLSLEELNADWTKEIAEGSLRGLVVSKEILPALPPSDHFTPFDDNHDWIPYRGLNKLT